jgi:hypothetical protein
MPSERVLIVAKTRMYETVCVGAITTEGISRRLLTAEGENQPFDTPYQVGDVWEIEYELPDTMILEAPHIEDIFVTDHTHEKSNVPMVSTLAKIIKPWHGDVTQLFGGFLQFNKKGTAYIERVTGIPDRSTWFWKLDQPLIYEDEYYYYQNKAIKFKVKYVGFNNPLSRLEANTLLRVSVARWHRFFDSDDPERCYMQLSGWYT